LDYRDSSDESNKVIHNLYIFFWQLRGAIYYSPLHNIITPKKAPPPAIREDEPVRQGLGKGC
jgi:hypothetical protein